MVTKINGFAKTPDQFMSAGFFVYKITTTADTTTTVTDSTYGGTPHNAMLDLMLQVISMFAQPVVLGPTATGDLVFAIENGGLEATDAAGVTGMARLQTALRAADAAFSGATVAAFALS